MDLEELPGQPGEMWEHKEQEGKKKQIIPHQVTLTSITVGRVSSLRYCYYFKALSLIFYICDVEASHWYFPKILR